MHDCYTPRPSHVTKEGRHLGEERWTGRSSLRRFVRLIVYGRCLQRCIVMLEPKRMRGKHPAAYVKWIWIAPTHFSTPFFSSASCAVPVAAVALRLCRSPSLYVLETMEPRVNTAYFGLTFGVQCAMTLYCEQRYASIDVVQRHARTPRWLERRIVNPPLTVYIVRVRKHTVYT